MRAGLQKIAVENTFSADPANPAGATIDANGDLTRKKLALLNWDSALIAQVITTLNDTRTYSVTLSALHTGIVFPAELQNTLAYDSDTHILSFARAMTVAEKNMLLTRPNADVPFMTAIKALFDAPRTFIARNLHSFSVPEYQVPLAGLPAGVSIPAALWRKVYYNSTTKDLHSLGALTESERGTLLALSNDAAYQTAVNALYDAPNSFTPTDAETFLLPADSSAFFDSATDGSGAPITPETRFRLVLQKLLPYLRTTLSHNLVIQHLGEALQVENKLAQALLTRWIKVPTAPGQKAIETFLVDAFAQSNPKNTITRAAFGDQFTTYTLLYKVALLITRLKITALQLNWLFAYRQQPGDPTAAWLDLNALPLSKLDDASGLFTRLTRLLDLCTLRASLPGGETTLNAVFAQVRASGATPDALLAYLNTQAKWALPELTFLTGAQGFNCTFPAAFEDEIALSRIAACLALLTHLGMSSTLCRKLGDAATMSNPTQAEGVARAVKQAVKAQYDEEQWVNTTAQPLCDILREKQRAALVAYLVTHPDQAHGQYWRTRNDLHAHFLIDVEMSPCQMTSRIKQAMSSTQLFVQRCLMNLEPEVMASTEIDSHWQEWNWMKSYRVWEANREIFLYPENWIEPELRDDKSPFFKELESELQQNSLTKDTAEAAFQHYLEKLDAVAHLEIVSLYHQQEYNLAGTLVVDTLHTVGRTRGVTPVYYYRQRVNTNGAYSWAAWQKITADVQGDHVFPLIWNRRLYLFWAVLSTVQPPQPVMMPEPGGAVPESASFWKIQLAWSEFQNDKWTSKTLSRDYLRCWKSGGDGDNISDFDESDKAPQHHGQSLFTFKAALDPNSDNLDILCVYDPLNTVIEGIPRTHERYGTGILGLFHFAGCSSLPVAVDLRVPQTGASSNVRTPKRTRVHYMTFSEFDPSDKSPWRHVEKFDPADDSLYLMTRDFPPGATRDQIESSKIEIPVLAKTPGLFQLVDPYQDEQFTSQRPFFFQHDNRAFFVEPQVYTPPIPWWLEHVDPGTVPLIGQKYYTYQPGLQKPIGPISNPGDPLIYAPSYELGQPLGANLGGALVNTGLAPAITASNGANRAGIAHEMLGRQPASLHASGSTLARVKIPVGLLNPTNTPDTVFLPPIQQSSKIYHFSLFYHPYVCEFVRAFNRDGVDGLLQRPLQLLHREFFKNDYAPIRPRFRFWRGPVVEPYPQEEVDFSSDGAYSLYNWELFFHVPLLIASRLSQNQQFEDAQHWFHYIFDPTDTSSLPAPERYWRTKPFYLTSKAQYQQQDISAILNFLAQRGNQEALSQLTPDQLKQLQDLENDVAQGRADPFDPDLIARTRTEAYQKSVVMKYLDNLIACGDRLFRGDTLELINEATQIYILAANILGRRPEEIPPRAIPEVQTYNSLESSLDSLSNALVRIEEFVPPSAASDTQPTGQQPQVTLPSMLYFCVPKNDQLLGYWDTIADRLFKIRHCMNIEGVVQKLPLFEPQINPALLVQAQAAGVDLSSALNDINAALPYYRFTFLVQKASELCGELKSLGSALLSTLEKRDAEALALLRSTQEVIMLNAVRQVKQQQVDEATASLAALQAARDMVNERYKYYSTIAFMNGWEIRAMLLQGGALILQSSEADSQKVAGVLHLFPDIKIGAPTTDGETYGGSNVGSAAAEYGAWLGTHASIKNARGSMAATYGSYQRRKDEWDLQARLAQKELAQIEQQILAATIRQSIAVQELTNHDLQISNAQAVDDFMHSKFTNQDLYDWMVGQIADIYFQSYQLAYDLAKKVEQSYRYELGLQDSNFIQFGYWDSLKKGLLAGELLAYDLKRMELSYLDQCKREYEITRSISLAQLDPVALVQLKHGGQCFFNVPEAIFDLDYPGHYMRRIKSASVTIPCVAGPYTNVSSKLSLLSSSVRQSNTLLSGKYARQADDPRFSDRSGIVESIVTSSGQSDSGLFETNLRDERYLPFEGSGAISSWGLELPQAFHQFDYNTISDVILHIRYTAREGGASLKQQAVAELQSALNAIALDENQKGLARLVSLRHEFPSEWYRFLHPAGATDTQSLTFALTAERFPFLSQGRQITLGKFEVFVQVEGAFAGMYKADTLKFALAPGNSAAPPTTVQPGDTLSLADWNGLLRGEKAFTFNNAPGNWTLNGWLNAGERLDPNAIEDIVVVCHYAIT
jgi:Tc toxin complex TcA C-terminal TcB-binding domain/Neuraminidase-like domain